MFYVALTLHLLNTPIDTTALLPFVPQQHHIISIAPGDFNSDGLEDFILITGNDHLSWTERDSSEATRSFIILLQNKKKELKQALRNDHMILCRECGGAFGDPFSGIEVRKNGFSVYHYGGASYRWTIDNAFAWSEKDKTWYLEKTVKSGYHNYDPNEADEDETIIPEQPVAIGDFKQNE